MASVASEISPIAASLEGAANPGVALGPTLGRMPRVFCSVRARAGTTTCCILWSLVSVCSVHSTALHDPSWRLAHPVHPARRGGHGGHEHEPASPCSSVRAASSEDNGGQWTCTPHVTEHSSAAAKRIVKPPIRITAARPRCIRIPSLCAASPCCLQSSDTILRLYSSPSPNLYLYPPSSSSSSRWPTHTYRWLDTVTISHYNAIQRCNHQQSPTLLTLLNHTHNNIGVT